MASQKLTFNSVSMWCSDLFFIIDQALFLFPPFHQCRNSASPGVKKTLNATNDNPQEAKMLKRSLTIFGNVCNTSCLCVVLSPFASRIECSFEEHIVCLIRISSGYFVPVKRCSLIISTCWLHVQEIRNRKCEWLHIFPFRGDGGEMSCHSKHKHIFWRILDFLVVWGGASFL